VERTAVVRTARTGRGPARADIEQADGKAHGRLTGIGMGGQGDDQLAQRRGGQLDAPTASDIEAALRQGSAAQRARILAAIHELTTVVDTVRGER
jgi:hypothetical protein